MNGPVNVTSTSSDLALQQLIFDGGRIAAGVRAAQRNETSFADVYRRDLQTVAFNVATAYYNYLAAQRTTAVDVEIVRENQVQTRFRRGANARRDRRARRLATAQLPTAQARLAVVKAQGAELAAQAAFANAMGLNANTNVQPIDDTPLAPARRSRSVPFRPTPGRGARDRAATRLRLRRANRAGGAVQPLRPPVSVCSRRCRQPQRTGHASTDVGRRPSATTRRSASRCRFRSTTKASPQPTPRKPKRNSTRLNAEPAKRPKLGIQLNVKQALTNLVSARGRARSNPQSNYRRAQSFCKRPRRSIAPASPRCRCCSTRRWRRRRRSPTASTRSTRFAKQQQPLYADGEIGQT